MKNYEIMFIVRPNLGEDEVKKVVDSFTKVLTSNGAKVTESKDMGQRELAYEINDYKNGFYFLINLEASDNKAISEFDRQARNSKDIVRHLITKIED